MKPQFIPVRMAKIKTLRTPPNAGKDAGKLDHSYISYETIK
jgi:hypothetical protein